MASPEHHRSTAEALLAKAQSYGPSAAARLAVLAEAQIHATLALSAPVVVNQTIVAAEDTADDTPAPAPKRRTRKAAPAKDEEADK